MGRNGQGVREASSSSYEVTFTYRGVRCRERVPLKPSNANLRKVTNFLGSVHEAIAKGTFDYAETFPKSKKRFQFIDRPGEALTVQVYLDGWHEQQKPHLKASTYDDYRKTIKRLNEAMGNIILSELKRTHVATFLRDLKVSNKTLSNLQSPLRIALQHAVIDEIIETNPLFGWSYQRVDAPKEDSDVDPFTREEQALILGQLTGQVRNAFQFAFWTGLRTSELVALDWDAIDWQRREFVVRKAKTLASKEIERPKTKSSIRTVRLLEPAYQALIAQKPHTFLIGNEVFQHPGHLARWAGDKPLRESYWKPAVLRAGIRYRRPYQTRHTFASMMLSAGEDPMWVASQMGHKDWGMIRRIYGKYMPDAIPNAGEKAVGIFSDNATS